MACQHVWQKEPPDAISRTSEDKYGDKRDLAHNSFWTSLEELQRLRLLVDEDWMAYTYGVVLILWLHQGGQLDSAQGDQGAWC